MPSVQSELIANGPSSSRTSADSSVVPPKLRGITESELKLWRKAVKDPAILTYEFLDLHEIFDYPFKDRDAVWVHIKEDDQWCLGQVTGRNIRIGPTRDRRPGFYFPVIFGKNRHIRRYFSPLNGEMKPDNENIREMLTREGWLYDDEDESSDFGSSADGGSSSTDT